MEIRTAGRVLEGPVRQRAILILDDGREAKREISAGITGKQALQAYYCVQLQFVRRAAQRDLRVEILSKVRIRRRNPLAIALECIHCPFPGRRKIELVIAGRAAAGEEEFAARVLPEP